jgi:hypothetical protein
MEEDIENTHYSESKCSTRENYVFEAIAALDGSKDIGTEKDFDELNKNPKFCLLVDKQNGVNHLYDRLFLPLPDYSNIYLYHKYVPVIQEYIRDINIMKTNIFTKLIKTKD